MAVNTIRFSGMASGIDTESIVNAMLLNEKGKIDKQRQQQALLNMKKDAWKEMNTSINSFYTKYIDKLRMKGTYESTKINVSNSAALDVRTDGTLPPGTHEITNTELAKSAHVLSNQMGRKSGFTEAFSKDTTLSQLGINAEDTIAINGDPNKSVKITSDMKLGDLEAALKEVAPELSINFDYANETIFINSKNTGAKSNFSITTTNGNTLSSLGLADANQTTAKVQAGSDASMIYNGVKITSSTNSIKVNGLEITLKQPTTQSVYISATTDTEGIVGFVKEFVEDYNKLIDDINLKLGTRTSRDYEPLTDDQKKEMSEDDIKAWENKIKEGLFYRDSGLTQVRDTLREGLNKVVDTGSDEYKMLSQLGITTGSWQEKGKLQLDEDKLKKALEQNPDQVVALLAGTGEKGEPKGIFSNLNDQFKELYKSTNLKSYGSFYNDKLDTEKLSDIAENIIKLQTKYDSLEKMYYAKFTAMEKALSQINSQSASLTSMLGA